MCLINLLTTRVLRGGLGVIIFLKLNITDNINSIFYYIFQSKYCYELRSLKTDVRGVLHNGQVLSAKTQLTPWTGDMNVCAFVFHRHRERHMKCVKY